QKRSRSWASTKMPLIRGQSEERGTWNAECGTEKRAYHFHRSEQEVRGFKLLPFRILSSAFRVTTSSALEEVNDGFPPASTWRRHRVGHCHFGAGQTRRYHQERSADSLGRDGQGRHGRGGRCRWHSRTNPRQTGRQASDRRPGSSLVSCRENGSA